MLRENTLKSLNYVRGYPRLNFPLEFFFCAIFSKKVSFDANLYSKHENQVASAISLAVSILCKFSVEAAMKKYAPGKMMHDLFAKRTPPYFSESVTETNRSKKMSFK